VITFDGGGLGCGAQCPGVKVEKEKTSPVSQSDQQPQSDVTRRKGTGQGKGESLKSRGPSDGIRRS
jgi:hypothetical protein